MNFNKEQSMFAYGMGLFIWGLGLKKNTGKNKFFFPPFIFLGKHILSPIMTWTQNLQKTSYPFTTWAKLQE